MSDTRKDKRAPVSLKVRFKSATVDEFIEHYCKDVSRGGIFIKSSQPMPVGTLLKFQFQLKDESQLIKGVGRVVWTRSEDRAGPDRPAGMGIKFIKMDNESRVMVDRIISNAEGTGAYEEGRETGISADSVTPPPMAPASSSGFFPDVGPAELPPPEDRTAVRQAAEFLAAAFSEVSDEAAAREAEQKAEEARERTKQIEAQRVAEAEQQRKPSGEALPSMIIDPGLSVPPPPARPSDRPTAQDLTAGAPEAAPAKVASLPPPAKIALPPMAPPASPAPAPQTARANSLPPVAESAEKRSPVLPIIAIAAVLGVAAFVGLRGGPTSTTDPSAGATEATQPSEPAAPAAPEPAPEPQLAEPAPEPVAPTPEPEPEPVAPTPAAEMVPIRVSTQPPGADVSVGGVSKGAAPVVVELEKGQPATITVSLSTYATATEEITPESEKTVRFALKALPYVLHVDTTPPGATVLVTGKRGTSPADLTWTVPPKTALKASAKLAGYLPAEAPVALDAFSQTEDAMRASVQLTLQPAPEKPAVAPAPVAAPKPAKPAAVAKPKPEPVEEGSEPAPTEARPEEPKPVETAPAPKAEEPKPEPEPAPKVEEPKPEPPKAEPPKAEPKPERLPDNPFG